LQGQGCPEFYQHNNLSSEQNSSGMQVNTSGQLVDTTFQPLNVSNGPNASQFNSREQTISSIQLNNSAALGMQHSFTQAENGTPTKRIVHKKQNVV